MQLDPPHEVGTLVRERHHVGDPEAPGRGRVRRLERRAVPDVPAGAPAGLGRPDQPATVVGAAEQGGEAGGGVEAGQAEPVDRPVLADQGGGAGVADHGVVLDRQGHPATVAGNPDLPAYDDRHAADQS